MAFELMGSDGMVPSRKSRLRRGLLAALMLGSASGFLSVTPALATTKAPEVGYLPASNVSTTSATIEVPIDPEGGETSYEIWLTCQSAQESNQACDPLTVGPQRLQDVLAAGFEQRTVTDPVTGLQPDYLYEYEVVASNSDGREGYIGDGFITCPSQGLCPRQPFLEGTSLWVWEGALREASEAPSIGEREAREHREAEERPANEAAERAAKERESREAGERAGREAGERAAAERAPKCVVPRLKGDSLTQARRALSKAHCRVGKLTEPREYHGPLVVVRQSIRRGSKLTSGTRVAMTLDRAG